MMYYLCRYSTIQDSGYDWFVPKETQKEREKSERGLIDGTQR